MEFSARLRLAMGDMTQEELACLSGVAQGLIARYLSGQHTPGYENLIALQSALPRLSVPSERKKARRVSTTSRSKTKG